MAFEQLEVALLGAIIGAVSGFVFYWNWEKRKKINEINKIKKLLNDDFSRIYEVSMMAFKDAGEMLEEDKIKNFVDDLIKNNFPSEFVSIHYYTLTFVFWNSVVTSGSLIKLSLEEIREVETVYRVTSSIDKMIGESYVAWRNTISKFVLASKITDEDKDFIESITVHYFKELGMNAVQIKETMDEYLKDIDWIKLPKLVQNKTDYFKQ